MFVNDFDLKIHLYGDEGKFALVTVNDGREKAFNKLPFVSIPIENVTPEAIGEKIAEYIRNNCTEEDGWMDGLLHFILGMMTKASRE